MLGAIPLGSVVALEVLIIAGLLFWRHEANHLWWALPVALLLLMAVVTRADEPWLVMQCRRIAFTIRSRLARRSVEDAGTVAEGLLPGLFPDLQVRRGHSRTGQVFGVATCGALAVSVVEIRHTSSGLLHLGAPAGVPLERITRRVTTTGIPLHSLALVTTAVGGPAGHPSSVLGPVLRDLGEHAVGMARSTTVVAIRLDPLRASAAIQARGGGHRGLVSALATLTNLVEAELRAEGLGANAMEPEEMVGHLRDSLFEPEDHAGWRENWANVFSGSLHHSTLVMDRWRPHHSLESLLTHPGPGTVSVVEVLPDLSPDPERLMMRTWVRRTDPDPAALRLTTRSTARSAPVGMRFTAADGQHLAALRSTTVLGGAHAPQA